MVSFRGYLLVHNRDSFVKRFGFCNFSCSDLEDDAGDLIIRDGLYSGSYYVKAKIA